MYNDRVTPQIGFASYADQCQAWRQSLSEGTLRSLAADYLRGFIDPCTTDAFAEYEHRWGMHTKNPIKIKEKTKRGRPARPK